MTIPENLYREIIARIPIICVDIIIRSETGRILLVRRANEPLKGEWWVVGGRIVQGETVVAAVRRKLMEEVGIELDEQALEFTGYYQDVFDKNSFCADTVYHTISLVFSVHINADTDVSLDQQSTDWTWAASLPPRFIVNRCIGDRV